MRVRTDCSVARVRKARSLRIKTGTSLSVFPELQKIERFRFLCQDIVSYHVLSGS